MADITVIRRGMMLVPGDLEAQQTLAKYPMGRLLKADVRQPRNYEFHKKVFSLIELTYQYWEPDHMVTQIERQTCVKLGRFLVKRGLDKTATKNVVSEFLKQLNASRETLEPDKSIEAFRHWVTKEAGFYDVVITPDGPRREARSWSFAKMSEEEFEEMFRAILSVCWKLVLNRHFSTEQEAENAAMQLSQYD